jgi:NADH dehydrogenase
LVADLGGAAAVARPLGLPLTGLTAKVTTKGYHLYALPAAANRLRVATDWAVNLVSRPIAAQLGLVDPTAARLTGEQGAPSVAADRRPPGPDGARAGTAARGSASPP